jgi:hypothetical protein
MYFYLAPKGFLYQFAGWYKMGRGRVEGGRAWGGGFEKELINFVKTVYYGTCVC